MDITPGPLLRDINTPADLRLLDKRQLVQVCDELREFIVDSVSIYGGHFGASLGVTELTVALHYALNTPTDQLVWDVGHQAYGHKILTGRRERFHTNRTLGGLAGFPNRAESEYDTFGVGHSSTSISAALGMALAAKHQGLTDRQHVAVIGDGALTGGMAFEAMNHAGVSDTNLTIILNDNCMSIDPNVGALKDYLTDITTSHTYNKLRDEVWHMLGKFRKLGEAAKDMASTAEAAVKSLLLKHSNLFESLNLRYFGPVDGHDVNHLVDLLRDLRDIPGPKLLHVITTKGKGYLPAEKEQTKWHAPGTFDKISGVVHKKEITEPQAPKYQVVFGETIVELAEADERIVGITPAMPSGSSMNIMMKAMPDRAYDVGIAEQHAVTLSAGMATQGLKPFCNIYSSFMQRAYDQVIHDVAIQNLPVVFCMDRGGLAGADGATHHGAFDMAYMRCLPNMVVCAPMNEAELRHMMYTATQHDGPFSIRYPRGQGVMPSWRVPFDQLQIGKGRMVSNGEDVAILTIGTVGNHAQEAIGQLEEYGARPAHFDLRFVKPLDEELLHGVMKRFKRIITVEDGAIMGGFGSAVLEFIHEHGYQAEVKRLGVPDKFIEHGTQQQLYALCGYDAAGIAQAVKKMLHPATVG